MALGTGQPVKGSIELLAFVSMVKNARSNSVLYKDAAYKMARNIGLSDGRLVKKYLDQCIVMGLCTEHEQSYNTKDHRTVYKFIAYKEALSILLGIKEAQLKYFPLHKNAGKFKNYQYQIELDLVALSYAQQAYKTASNFPNRKNIMGEINNLSKLPVSVRHTRSNRSKRSRLLKKLTSADAKCLESHLKGNVNGVVTGCNQIGKLIGRSGTTGFKRLKMWSEANQIQLHDIVYFQPASSKLEASYMIETFVREKVKGIHVYSSKEGSIKSVVGKKVLGFASAGFKYGSLS